MLFQTQICHSWITTTLQLRESESSFQRLFGRRTRTLFATSSRLLVPETGQGVPHKLKERKAKQTYYYNRGAKELSKL